MLKVLSLKLNYIYVKKIIIMVYCKAKVNTQLMRKRIPCIRNYMSMRAHSDVTSYAWPRYLTGKTLSIGNIVNKKIKQTSIKNKLKDEVGMTGSKSTQTRFVVGIIIYTIHPYAWFSSLHGLIKWDAWSIAYPFPQTHIDIRFDFRLIMSWKHCHDWAMSHNR